MAAAAWAGGGDASGGVSVRSGRPVPSSSAIVSGGPPRVITPLLDLGKGATPLPPPPPPNWEVTELSDGAVRLYVEALPALRAHPPPSDVARGHAAAVGDGGAGRDEEVC